ncbi:2401_t:CDS:2 [Funneliformis caledonium]|uniref:2401_t:CDS:1 n=1 Tax=Funneliformis caledonium TaxID=1117310 RepID=A0A9N9BX40_9GLOM|nr:2401_t:CDS:2 [Funneliformis caledonium]
MKRLLTLRIRPLTSEDLANLPTRFQKSVLSTTPNAPNQVIVTNDKNDKKQTFNYDYVFDPESTQKDVYDNAVLKLTDKFLEGYNVTILAYGQTSSGKTFTMGTSENGLIEPEAKGIIPRSISTLFSSIQSDQYKTRKFSMKVSFIEIYNEDLIDLFYEGDDESRPQVLIREDSKGNILWSGLQEIKVNSVEEVMEHLSRGSLNRQTGATDMNAQSSRSHAIFSVTLEQQKFASRPGSMPPPIDSQQKSGVRPLSRSSSSKRLDDGENISITSKFHFVDLAGSERLKRTSAMGERVKEGISINSGLLALGNVISALGDPNKAKHTTHIPYRDSKLTRLLQDSLGGNAQTLMIACVTPAEYNINETVNTLKYANRAKNIKNNATVNAIETGWNDIEHLQASGIISSNGTSTTGTTSGRTTPGINGRETPHRYINGRETPQRYNTSESPNDKTHSSTSSNIPIMPQQQVVSNKDVKVLEEQLLQLKRSYSELSQRYAKTSAELATHQDNTDGLDIDATTEQLVKKPLSVINELDEKNYKNYASFQEAAEPVIEEYEKSISSLESQLALSKAALLHSDSLLQEHERKLAFAEQSNEQSKVYINDLKNKVAKLVERESISEQYIKELETKFDKLSSEQGKDQNLINELRSLIAQMKANNSNSDGYTKNLENRMSISDNKSTQLVETVKKLEERLHQREAECQELEEKLRRVDNDDEKKLLLNELDDREKRILHLEQKVESLIRELEELRNHSLSHDDSELSVISEDIHFASPSITPGVNNDPMNLSPLESKFLDLQKTHENTLKEFEDIKSKYHLCLLEIHELRNQLSEENAIHPEMVHDFKSTPTTPLSPKSPDFNAFRLSLPPTTSLSNDNKSANSKLSFHRKTRSLTEEIYGSEEKDDAHLAVIQKLSNELQQLSSLHEDKDQGLVAIKQEFARLEMNYRENLELVVELRDEIKRRDALVQVDVMSAKTSETGGASSYYSVNTSETDTLEIVQRMREEVEQLREEHKIAMESLSERETRSLEKRNEVLRIESSIQEFQEELSHALDNNEDDRVIELQSRIKELEHELIKAQEIQRQEQISETALRLEDGFKPSESGENIDLSKEFEGYSNSKEILALKQRIDKLQSDIESKSRTIASLLLPTVEQQNVINRIETELQEVRETQRKMMKENNQLGNIPDKNKNDNKTVKTLEARVKELESQLTKAKEAQHIPTPRNSFLRAADPAHRTVCKLQDKLSDLQKELSRKSETVQNLEVEMELVSSMQSQLETLKNDTKRKYELIEGFKRDLVDKGMLQQKLHEKEAEAKILQDQLLTVRSEMQHQIEVLRSQLQSEKTLDGNLNIYTELENVQKELKEAKENENLAVERLRMLNDEELKLQQDLQRLRQDDIVQKERITVLESSLVQELAGSEDLVSLRAELALTKGTEATQKQKISKLENTLKEYEAEISEHKQKSESLEIELKQVQEDTIANTKDELAKLKETESQLRSTIQELEAKLAKADKENEQVQMIKDELKLLKELDLEQKSKIEQLQYQLEETQSTKNIAIKELESMKKDFAAQKELVITLEGELKNVREELIKTNEQYGNNIKKHEQISILLNTTKQQRDEEESKVKSLENEIEMLKAAGDANEKVIVNLNTELTNSKMNIEAQNKRLFEIENQKNLIEKERELLLDSDKELSEILRAREFEKNKAIVALENKISDLQSQLEQAKEASKVDQETIASLEEKLASINFQLNDAKESEERRFQIIKELETELNEANALLLDKNSKCAELETTIEKIRTELKNLKASEAAKNDQINQFKSGIEQAKCYESQQTELILCLESQLQKAEEQNDDHSSKLAEANSEIDTLKEKCVSLQNKINEVHHDSLLKNFSNIDDDLTKELKNVLKEVHAQKERADTLQKEANKLKSEKNNHIVINADLAQQIERLQKDLEFLTEEYAEAVTKQEDTEALIKDQKIQLSELETALEVAKKSQPLSINSNPSLTKLAAANESLRQTNDDLNKKITEAEHRASSLSVRLKTLENELESTKTTDDDSSVDALKAKIQGLEVENEGLKQSNEAFLEERVNLDQRIEHLVKQLQTSGQDGNKTAVNVHLAELNLKVLSLEKEMSQEKLKAKENTSEMQKEILSLIESNKQLEHELNVSKYPLPDTIGDSGDSLDLGYTSKLYQESTISQQNILIKALQDKINELEKQAEVRSSTPIAAELDAVGGYRASSPELRKNAVRAGSPTNVKTLPPTPPPNQPLPPPPPPPKSPLPPRPESRNSSNTTSPDLIMEVQKLNKRIAKMEGENLDNRQLVDTLEASLNDSESNLRTAKQQLQILQREKSDLMNQMKSLQMQLEETEIQYERTKTSVQKEKRAIENVLLEERRAKEQAEKARRQLENRMEELMAKKSKFMCF